MPNPSAPARLRSYVVVGALLAACLPTASATMSVQLTVPKDPIPLTGGVVGLVLTIDCSDVVLHGTHDPVPIALNLTAGPLKAAGPVLMQVPQPDCAQDETGKWTGNASYTLTGPRWTPGLTPLLVTATATIVTDETDTAVNLAHPTAPATANASIRVAPLVSVNIGPGPRPATTNGSVVQLEIPIESQSNLPVRIAISLAKPNATATPMGNLTMASGTKPLAFGGDPTVVLVVPALGPGQAKAEATLRMSYHPPAGAAHDRFVVDVRPSVAAGNLTLAPTPITIDVTSTGPATHPGATASTTTKPSPAAGPLIAFVVVAGWALRRRA